MVKFDKLNAFQKLCLRNKRIRTETRVVPVENGLTVWLWEVGGSSVLSECSWEMVVLVVCVSLSSLSVSVSL